MTVKAFIKSEEKKRSKDEPSVVQVAEPVVPAASQLETPALATAAVEVEDPTATSVGNGMADLLTGGQGETDADADAGVSSRDIARRTSS